MEAYSNDELKKAVIACANGEPLPGGWICVSGTELTKIVEYEKELTLKRERKLASSNKVEAVSDLPEAESGTSLDLVYGDE